MEKKKRVIIEVDPLVIDLLAQHNEVRIDDLGRVYGLGEYLSRCARHFGGRNERP